MSLRSFSRPASLLKSITQPTRGRLGSNPFIWTPFARPWWMYMMLGFLFHDVKPTWGGAGRAAPQGATPRSAAKLTRECQNMARGPARPGRGPRRKAG